MVSKVVRKLSLEEEKAMVERAQADIFEFDALYQYYFTRIYNYCYFHTFEAALAEDICSQIFLKALESFSGFQWRGVSFGAWLFRIASNQVKNHYRDHKKVIDLDQVSPLELSSDPELEAKVDIENRARTIRQLIEKMAFQCKEVLILRFYEELSYEDISERAESTVAACKMRVKRCLEKLKESLVLLKANIAST